MKKLLIIIPAATCVMILSAHLRPNSTWGAPPGPPRGLTEPYRQIDVAAVESGVIANAHVSEGDLVSQGQVLASLDAETFLALLAIADKSRKSRGRLQAAQAEVRLKQVRAENFAKVFASGHARPEEVRRAHAEFEIAQAHLLEAEEDLAVKQLEYEKIKTQVERRTIRAPISGIVSRRYKEEGEFVAPNDPVVMTLVQLDPLLAVFSITSEQSQQLKVGQQVPVKVARQPAAVVGIVEFIAPVTDAESGTILVKIRLDNSEGQHRSGSRCSLQFPDESVASQPSREVVDTTVP